MLPRQSVLFLVSLKTIPTTNSKMSVTVRGFEDLSFPPMSQEVDWIVLVRGKWMIPSRKIDVARWTW